MNYIRQLNGFYDFIVLNPIPSNAQSLYYALLHRNNLCGWRKNFSTANLTLQTLTSLSRAEVHKMRCILMQKGLIHYEKGKGSKAGTYQIVSLYDTLRETGLEAQTEAQTDTQTEAQTDTQTEAQTEHKSIHIRNTLIKQKPKPKLKQNKTTTDLSSSSFKKILQVFNQKIHPITEMDAHRLKHWVEDGMEEALVIKAIEEAFIRNNRNMRYIQGILNNWDVLGLQTLDDYRIHKQQQNQAQQDKFEIKGRSIDGITNGKNPDISFDKSKFLYKGGESPGV